MTARRIAIGWLFILALVACGPTARQRAIRATLTALDASSAGLVTFSDQREKAIVAAAPDKPSGQAALLGWRSQVDKVVTGLTAAYRAVAVAATVEDDKSLSGMLQAAAIVAQEMKELGVVK